MLSFFILAHFITIVYVFVKFSIVKYFLYRQIVIYMVKSGDTLWKIAKRFGSTVDDIARVNGMERPDRLNIGEKIYIPKYVLKRAKEPIII